MALDIYVMAAKGRHEEQAAAGFWDDKAKDHQDVVVAHGGHLNDDEWREPVRGNICSPDAPRAYMVALGPAKLLEPALLGFAGKHPAELLAALPRIYKALNKTEKKLAFQSLMDVHLACEHAIKLENHPQHGELYEDVRVVIVKD